MLAFLPDSEIRKLIPLARAGNVTARNQIIESNLGLLYKASLHSLRRYPSQLFAVDDLVSEGMFGIITAIDLFDLKRCVKFSTYAMMRIKRSIQYFRLTHTDLIRKPYDFNEFSRTESRLKMEGKHGNMANHIGISKLRYHIMKRVPRQDKSPIAMHNMMLTDDEKEKDYIDTCEYLENAVSNLPLFERSIMELYIKGMTYEDIGLQIGMCKCTVGSYVRMSISKMRKREEEMTS